MGSENACLSPPKEKQASVPEKGCFESRELYNHSAGSQVLSRVAESGKVSEKGRNESARSLSERAATLLFTPSALNENSDASCGKSVLSAL